MRKEIKHHIFTASLYEFKAGAYCYCIVGVCFVYYTHTAFIKATIQHLNAPHLFELINICISELNQKSNQ